MSALAFLLILIAACTHAIWNYLAKRVAGGLLFIWLLAAVSSLLYLPALAVYVYLYPVRFGAEWFYFIFGTSVLHLLYLIFLKRGYESGDLSLVYPIARGSGPFLATVGAIVILGERPSWLALLGVLFIVGGVFFLARSDTTGDRRNFRSAILFGVLTGVTIAIYTVWDKYAVTTVGIPPLLLEYGTFAGHLLFLAPYAFKRRREISGVWRDCRWEIVGVALLGPFSYILVLSAMVFTPVSYVAPAREVSILIGAVLGKRLLAEEQGGNRLPAAVAIVCGLVLLALN